LEHDVEEMIKEKSYFNDAFDNKDLELLEG
jgi:hypothetical protein